jgi:hypothetical protein
MVKFHLLPGDQSFDPSLIILLSKLKATTTTHDQAAPV